MPIKKSTTKKIKAKDQQPRIHRHVELAVKFDEGREIMKLMVKDKHLEMVPKDGVVGDGFVFCSAKSTETTKRWRMVLTAMLRLVDEAEKVLEEGN